MYAESKRAALLRRWHQAWGHGLPRDTRIVQECNCGERFVSWAFMPMSKQEFLEHEYSVPGSEE